MTVCIAAASDNGEYMVTATDGLLSAGDVTGESVIAKMLWMGDWQFMYAGLPAYFSLINEEMEKIYFDNPEAFSRRNVQETVRRAYRVVCSRIASADSLNPFDMTMDEFKQMGSETFPEPFHRELLRTINDSARQFTDQILVTGWGDFPRSVMVYEIGPSGDYLHTTAGFAAIGSGAQMAQTMLLLLGQGRHRTLAETIFNVACAKFSAEKSTGLDVGKITTIYVSRKRTDTDEPDKLCGSFVAYEDIDELRTLWESHLKPRIPDEARVVIPGIASRAGGKVTARDMMEHMGAAARIFRKYGSANSEETPSPQSTTADPSPQPPSQASPGETDES
jgi:hypothetical protein